MKLRKFIQNLLHRRVPQIMGAYFGVGLALIPFVGFLIDTYALPRVLLNAVLVAYVSVIPSVFLLAYNHGAPGKDPWILAERVGVPINLALAAGLLLLTAVSGGRAEAKIDTVVITDETGQAQERLVPKAKFRRKLGLFFWANESGDTALDWLRYGFPLMLERDLDQNRFVAAWTPFVGSLLTRLRRTGYDDALGVPMALQQEIADDFGWPAFTTGSFRSDAGRLTARLALYDTETAALRGERTAQGENPAVLIDELTGWLKAELEVEEIEGLGRDLPVEEHLSASREAVEKWVGGSVASELANDRETALALWREAVDLDPSFALAHRKIAGAYFALGKSDDAKAAIREAKNHEYRLSERDQFYTRGLEAFIDRDMDKAIKSYETLVKLYPDDVSALSNLANVYELNNRLDEAVATYEQVLDFDPDEDWAHREIGELRIAQRDYGSALEAFERYARAHTDDPDIRFSIAQLHQAQGDLATARATVEEASLLASDPITPALALAQIELSSGDVEAARGHLRAAEAEATVPQDVARVLAAWLSFHGWRGEVEQNLAIVSRLREAQLAFQPPISVAISEGFMVPALLGLVSRKAEGEAWIEDHLEALDPPYDRFGDLFYLQLYTLGDDADGIEAHLEGGRSAIETFSPRDDSRAQIEIFRGRALELRGEPAEAAAAYGAVLEALENSTLNLFNNQVRIQTLYFHARAAIDAGELDAAAGSLEEALRVLPAYPHANFQMARLERARGHLGSAREHLGRALSMWAEADPDYQPALEASRLHEALGGGSEGAP